MYLVFFVCLFVCLFCFVLIFYRAGNCVHDRRRVYTAPVILCTIVVYIPFGFIKI